MAFVFNFVASLTYIGVWATAVAAVVNLPVSAPVRFLILVLMWFAYGLSRLFQQLGERLLRIEYWARMSFVTLHVRNEAEGLASTLERVQQDLSGDGIERHLKGVSLADILFFVGSLIFFLIFLGVALDQGWFGSTAANWVSELWVQTNPLPN